MRDDRSIEVFILTQSPIADPLIDQLRSISPRLSIQHRLAHSVDEIDRSVWNEIEVLYTSWLMPSIDLVPNLKWVQGHFAGVDHFLDNPLIRSVILTTASGVHAPPMAEYILMMMLAFAHRLPNMITYQQRVDWPKDRWSLFAPKEL